MIQNFNDFVIALRRAGFSAGSGNNEGIFSLSSQFDHCIQWHTGDPETDPWEWRMRVLDECSDIAYSKVFFRKSGYIAKEWYPYFLAVRRGENSLYDEYLDGNISRLARQVYEVVSENECLPFHEIKRQCGISREESSRFESALIDLQMKMYITVCGRARKTSRFGEEYGWSSTVFCTTEKFFGSEVFAKVGEIDRDEAIEKITAQILMLNPAADSKKIRKFITG